MNAILLVIDRLHAGYLGAYGNSWIATPAIDRLAAEGFVFDQCLIDSPHLAPLYRGMWLGTHALAPSPGTDRRLVADPQGHVARSLATGGIAATLMTDDASVAAHPLAQGFQAVVRLAEWRAAGVRQGDVPVERTEDTHLAGCFAHLIDWLETAAGPFCLWCHLTGLGSVWDAPLVFRRSYMEEGDPEPPDSAKVPNQVVPRDCDPDELLGLSQAYAGQITLLDTCLGALAEFLQTSRLDRETVVVLLSARGYPLGEHGRLGACDEALYNELVHVPLILRFPDGLGTAGRSHALVQPADLAATLLDLWGLPADCLPSVARSLMPLVREEEEGSRDRLAIVGSGSERAMVTPAWHLRMAGTDELYVRPDDQWQVNDVADRCPKVAEMLRAEFVHFEQAVQSNQISQLPPLEESLLVPPE